MVRVRRGVLHVRPAATPSPEESADSAAVAMAHLLAGSALSHESAGRFHGLPVPLTPIAEGHITLSGARTRTAGRVRIHAQRLPGSHVSVVRETRVTSLARTAIDIARTVTMPEALICMDGVLRRLVLRHLDDPTALRMAVHEDESVDVARRTVECALQEMAGWPGTRSARRALRASDPAAESALESQSRGVLLEHGVPAPECGYPVEGADGRLYWVDMAWEGERVIGECDGLSKYTDPAILRREKLRQEALERAGWRVIRWTYTDILRAPQRVIDRVVHALDQGHR